LDTISEMLSPEDTTVLLRNLESDRVERTSSTKDTDKFAQAVCAFANDRPNHRLPGYLIVGARDDGTLTGTEFTDQLLQNLAALRSDGNVQPLPAISVARIALGVASVAVVEVQPSDLPPFATKARSGFL
jgi:ATP-dependent DNA helicase RecG